MIDRIASDTGLLEALREARADASAGVGARRGTQTGDDRPRRDADREPLRQGAGCGGHYKHGFGFHPMLAYFDETGEAAAGQLRPGSAGANTAQDQIGPPPLWWTPVRLAGDLIS